MKLNENFARPMVFEGPFPNPHGMFYMVSTSDQHVITLNPLS